jgi:flavodoxin
VGAVRRREISGEILEEGVFVKKFLVAYASHTGKTEMMAGYIAEGLRISGQDADLAKVSELEDMEALAGYDGYVFGSPTYNKEMAPDFKAWLAKVPPVALQGKIGASFGSHTHSGEAPLLLHEAMECDFQMSTLDLGALRLEEKQVVTGEGMRACQQFGRVLGERAA